MAVVSAGRVARDDEDWDRVLTLVLDWLVVGVLVDRLLLAVVTAVVAPVVVVPPLFCANAALENKDVAKNAERSSERFSERRGDAIAVGVYRWSTKWKMGGKKKGTGRSSVSVLLVVCCMYVGLVRQRTAATVRRIATVNGRATGLA